MIFDEGASKRRGRGRIELRGHRTRALSYSADLYEMIRVGKNFFSLINKGGTSLMDVRAQDMTTRQWISNAMISKQ
jgi:hypothetical protein